jgi:hypothetical protein
MKHFTFLSIILSVVMSLEAQNYVNLRFTSKMQGGDYQVLDSVKVMNLTRGWVEMLYYPDTTLQMTNSTGIAEVQTQGNALLQNIPNPFKFSTEVSIRLQASDDISLILYDMSGKQCAAYSAFLAAGQHSFNLKVGAAQAYILSLQTSVGKQSITVLASESGNAFRISHTNYLPQTDEKPIQKAYTDKEFQTGDNMKFIGYTTYDSTKKTHQLSVSQGGEDADYTFLFAIGYAVGDVYYNESGTADGIVCWIADTVFIDNGKYYGLYGKMISLDQPGKQQDGYYGIMYARSDGPTYAYDSIDGRVNTALHMALRSDTSNYPFKERIQAAKWCTDKGEGWYFPAKCEMYNVFQNVDLLNEALAGIGGELFFTEYGEVTNIYWTSTEINEEVVYRTAFSYHFSNGKIKGQHSPLYSRQHVRAMKWFNEPED